MYVALFFVAAFATLVVILWRRSGASRERRPRRPYGPAPTNLDQTERDFARDPGAAFIPLATAYLELGRFMEAMVICKKGIKHNPTSIPGRVLLARIYTAQGKVSKAHAELEDALRIDPTNASVIEALRALGLPRPS